MKNIINFTQWKNGSMWRSRTRSRTKSTSRSLVTVGAQYMECCGHLQYTLQIY